MMSILPPECLVAKDMDPFSLTKIGFYAVITDFDTEPGKFSSNLSLVAI